MIQSTGMVEGSLCWNERMAGAEGLLYLRRFSRLHMYALGTAHVLLHGLLHGLKRSESTPAYVFPEWCCVNSNMPQALR